MGGRNATKDQRARDQAAHPDRPVVVEQVLAKKCEDEVLRALEFHAWPLVCQLAYDRRLRAMHRGWQEALGGESGRLSSAVREALQKQMNEEKDATRLEDLMRRKMDVSRRIDALS